MLNSRSYKKSVKFFIQLVKTYLLLDKTPRSTNDINQGKVMTDSQIAKFSHFFSEVMKPEEKRRNNRDSFGSEDNNDSSVNAQKERIYVL